MAAARWTSCDRILPRTGSTIRSAESRPSATVAVSDTRAITPEKNEKMPRMAAATSMPGAVRPSMRRPTTETVIATPRPILAGLWSRLIPASARVCLGVRLLPTYGSCLRSGSDGFCVRG
ncbi:hypothetical protein GCM10018952_24250 [Streptosporangium vulgare]